MFKIKHPRCPFCHDDVAPGSGVAKVVCEGCHAFHHDECWHEGGGCSAGRCGSDIPVPVRLHADPPAPAPAPAPAPVIRVSAARPSADVNADAAPSHLTYLYTGPAGLDVWVRRMPSEALCVQAAVAAVEYALARYWVPDDRSPMSSALAACNAWIAESTDVRRHAALTAARESRSWTSALSEDGGEPGLIRLGYAVSQVAQAASARDEESRRRRAARAVSGVVAALPALRTGRVAYPTEEDREEIRNAIRNAILDGDGDPEEPPNAE